MILVDTVATSPSALARVLDLLAAVELDLRHVGALEEIAEDVHELPLLSRGERPPVLRHRPPGGLLEVEHLVRDLSDGPMAVRRPGRIVERGIIQDLEDPVDGSPELLGRAGAGAVDRGYRGQHAEQAKQGEAERPRDERNPHLGRTV